MYTIKKYSSKIDGFENMSFEERREVARPMGLCHTKKVLKEVFRLKPAPDADTDKSYKSQFGQEVIVYRIDECVPMRPATNKAQTVAQKMATAALVKKNRLNSKHNLIALAALKMIENDVVIIDTETTGLNCPHVIEISAVSSKSGKLLYSSLVYTDQEIEVGARNVHGIECDDIKDAPHFEQVAKNLGEIIGDRKWTSFNLTFDKNAISNSLENTSNHSWFENQAPCLMYLAADYFGATNQYGSISLATAMLEAGCEWRGRAHRAESDTFAATDVLNAIAANAIKP